MCYSDELQARRRHVGYMLVVPSTLSDRAFSVASARAWIDENKVIHIAKCDVFSGVCESIR